MRLTQRINDPNIWRIYFCTLGLGLAYGMAISLIAIFLKGQGFQKPEIGVLAAAFALGVVALSVPMGSWIRRWSAKTTLCVSLFGYGAAVTLFPFLKSFAAIAVVRFFDGAFSVGIWVSCETILLRRAALGHKAFIMSLYALAMAIGYVGGPVLARLLASVAPLAAGFVTAGVLAVLSGLYVISSLEPDSSGPSSVSTPSSTQVPGAERPSVVASPAQLFWRIKNSCFATFAYGYFQASVVLFLPLYLIENKGISEGQTIVIPAFFAGGMLLFINIAGRIGDRVGHLLTMRWLAIVGASMVVCFVFLRSYELMCLAVFIAGASLASISPVSLALQGVTVSPSQYGLATSIYNAFYAAGMLLGPPISSQVFETFDGAVMLYHLAVLWASFVAFSLVFYRDDPAARGPAQRFA